MANTSCNNQVIIKGIIVDGFEVRDEAYGTFYVGKVAVSRLSGESDIILVNFPGFMIESKGVGDEIAVLGQFRSRNVIIEGKSRLELMVYALSELNPASVNDKSTNVVMLSGFVCKPPITRTTPFGREIADILIAVNRGHKKSDYLPMIAWSTNARIAGSLVVGDEVSIIGRLQSRKYNKKLDNGEIETRTAYEVSVTKLITTEGNLNSNRLRDYFQRVLENVSVKYVL